MDINREKFTLKNMMKKLDEIMENYMQNVPKQVNLNIPKLKKVNKSKAVSPTIKLPKLKKVTEAINENN